MLVALNSEAHRSLHVKPLDLTSYNANVHYALITSSEISLTQNSYPLFFQKDSSTGRFLITALLGFQEGENLFLDQTGWNANYIPMSMQRQPFFIGQQKSDSTELIVSIDIDDPRVNDSEGKKLFDGNGKATDYLESVAGMLNSLHVGMPETSQFIDRLLQHNLVEPVVLNVSLNNYRQYDVPGLYTINEENLYSLNETVITQLFKNGDLQKIFGIISSQGNVSELVKRKRNRDNL